MEQSIFKLGINFPRCLVYSSATPTLRNLPVVSWPVRWFYGLRVSCWPCPPSFVRTGCSQHTWPNKAQPAHRGRRPKFSCSTESSSTARHRPYHLVSSPAPLLPRSPCLAACRLLRFIRRRTRGRRREARAPCSRSFLQKIYPDRIKLKPLYSEGFGKVSLMSTLALNLC